MRYHPKPLSNLAIKLEDQISLLSIDACCAILKTIEAFANCITTYW